MLSSGAFMVAVFCVCLISTVVARRANDVSAVNKHGDSLKDSSTFQVALASTTALVAGYWFNTNSSSSKSNNKPKASSFPPNGNMEEDRLNYNNYPRGKDGFPLENKDKTLIWREDGGISKLVPVHPTNKSIKEKKLKKFTMKEVAERCTAREAWIIIDERVYDITTFISKHPGGEKVLYAMAGKDCTDAFANYHSAAIYQKWLPPYLIGEVTDVPKYPHVQDFRNIRQELLRRGLFETDLTYYNKLACWYAILLLTSLYLSIFCISTVARMTGALVMGFFWQQLAGTGHDIGHSSLSHNFAQDNYYGALFGNALMGISVGWWKRSHNLHHIVCNSVENDCDIQHLPFLACTEKILEKPFWSTYHDKVMSMDFAAKFLVQFQHILFPIIMAVARFNLYAQSWILLLTTTNKDAVVMNYRNEEAIGLGIFVAWVSALLWSMPTYTESLGWLLLSHGSTALLHLQICYSHFSMETYHGTAYNGADDEWYKMQIKTTMNTDCYDLMDWFHIGLQYQIEHHLFPTLPRHNLPIAKKMVEEVCRKHDIEYQEHTFYQGVCETMRALRDTAIAARSGKYDVHSADMIRDLMNAHG